MVKKISIKNGGRTFAVSTLWGVAAFCVCAIALCAILACIVSGEIIPYNSVKSIVPVLLFVSFCAGGGLAAALAMEKKGIALLIAVGVGIFLLFGINVLVLDGTFGSVAAKLIGAIASAAAVFLILLQKGKGKRPVFKRRSR